MAQNLNGSMTSPAKPAAKRLIPILAGGAGLVLLAGGGILVMMNSKLTALQTAAQQKDAEVSDSQQIARRYQTTLDNYNDTQAHMKYLEASVSDKSYVPTLLAQLQGLAAQTHLTMSSVRPTVPPPVVVAATPAPSDSSAVGTPVKKTLPPPYDTLNVAVDVSGSYADTSMFLYSLTRFPKIISVGSVQMHPGPPATPGGPALVMTNLKLTAFIFHDAAADAAPTGSPAQTAAAPFAAQTSPTAAGASPTPAVPAATPVSPMPPAAEGTPAGAARRAAVGAAGAVNEVNSRSSAQISTL